MEPLKDLLKIIVTYCTYVEETYKFVKLINYQGRGCILQMYLSIAMLYSRKKILSGSKIWIRIFIRNCFGQFSKSIWKKTYTKLFCKSDIKVSRGVWSWNQRQRNIGKQKNKKPLILLLHNFHKKVNQNMHFGQTICRQKECQLFTPWRHCWAYHFINRTK